MAKTAKPPNTHEGGAAGGEGTTGLFGRDDSASPTTVLRIRSLLPSLAPAEQRVAQRIIADPEGVAASSITQLAKDCATSEATVIRFCRTIDFTGYRELRLALAAEAGQARGAGISTREFAGDINPDDTLVTVVQKIAYTDARAVEDTAVQLDIEVLQAVVERMAVARRIDIYGVGASGFVAADLQQKLHRIGITSFAWSDTHVMLTSAALLCEDDVALAVSHTGTTIDTIDALTEARRRGATTVAITNFPRSPISEAADHVLTTAARETTFRSGATASRLAQLTVIDCLFVGLAQSRYADSRSALATTYDAVRGLRVGEDRRRPAPRRRAASADPRPAHGARDDGGAPE
ncbi:MurR/RpiR family transcriptional regulator [Streptomonospora nanhaiensis]|uniref:DNA-binding MurR/RpiR family transcriptional regulator n=1 Tax=Streptomonospora nanhaiensis TaxID=1323731 RepID=A0A853BL46_9ACTN|nr:MurR/RpiR family transcriptional regulator [Streptomonospora nanhaiensis]MBV2365542.1 MurR/RpiR family transcriptional regulator [Streptomonospora nanhaiensis]MBX9391995.1 MurR/RpiR family transcriptional regulator [Streptomonospora nanhaiensis]NYI95720.1 DNA-binding MurR/RpiR family transcriptional regulator [Streptomonospora nanhaiensis]